MIRRWLVLPLITLISAHADTLIFHNGAKLTGNWVSVDEERVRFMTDGQVHAYSRADVSAVTFGDVPAIRTPAEPDSVGEVYVRDDSGALQPLERSRGIQRTGGSGGLYWEMTGAKCAVRLRTDQKALFVVRLPNGMSPRMFFLFPLETKQNKRRTQSDLKSRTVPLHLPLTITKVGEASYGLKSAVALAAGEYAFSATNSNDAYCFAVDPY